MARPVREMFPSSGPSNPRKRIRPFSGAVGQDGDSRAPIVVKGSASSAICRQGVQGADLLSGHPFRATGGHRGSTRDDADRFGTRPSWRLPGTLSHDATTPTRSAPSLRPRPRQQCWDGLGSKARATAPSCVWLLLGVGDAARAPWIGIPRGYLSPRLVMPRSPGLPFGFARFHRREYGAPRPSGLDGGGAKGFAPRRNTGRRPTAIRRREQDRARPWLARG